MNFSIKDFRVTLNFSAIFFIAFIVIGSFNTKYLLCFFAIIIHEVGHIIAMFLCNIKPFGIEITAFDIKIINNNRVNLSVLKDIFITIAGPLINFIFFVLFIFTYKDFAFVNICIGLFNLLPSSSLDGGQLLFLLLSRNKSVKNSILVIDIITIILSLPMFITGILIFINSKYNFSLIYISIYLILSVFLKKDKIF